VRSDCQQQNTAVHSLDSLSFAGKRASLYLLPAGAQRGICFWRDDTCFKFQKGENFIGAREEERAFQGWMPDRYGMITRETGSVCLLPPISDRP